MQKLERQKNSSQSDNLKKISATGTMLNDKDESLFESWDRDRSLRQGCIGGLMLGPCLHFFFTRIVPRVTYPGRSARYNIFMRVAA